jgi:hypothetical protein
MVSDEHGPRPTILEDLSRAVETWTRRGDGRALTRWLNRELDPEGAPVRLAISEWAECLERLARARGRRGAWPEGCAARIAGLVLTTLRFARPDGTPAADPAPSGREATSTWRSGEWADWYRGTGIARVLREWFPAGRPEGAPPPLPAWAAADRVLAILRADWLRDGDFLAVDHRDARSPCRFELFGAGRTWLGPEWSFGDGAAATSRPRPRTWITGPAADLAEWSYRLGAVRVTRSVLLLRGRRLALVSILVEARSPSLPDFPVRLALPSQVAAVPLEGRRAFVLEAATRRGHAQVLPIGLPCLAYPTERGHFRVEARDLVLSQAHAARRCWLPLLVSWDPARHRKSLHWRVLTVSERSRAARADRAFAARVSWGRDETYVVYRSLGPPAPRAFLGHQSRARFLFGRFTTAGDVRPILTVD